MKFFAQALSSVLDDVIGRNGSAAAVAVSNANVTSGDNASYASSYNSGNWTLGICSLVPAGSGHRRTDYNNPQLGHSGTSATYAPHSGQSLHRYLQRFGKQPGVLPGTPSYTGLQFQAGRLRHGQAAGQAPREGRLATPYSPPGTARMVRQSG